MAEQKFIKVGHHKDAASFKQHLRSIGIALPCDDAVLSAAQGSPFAAPFTVGGVTIGNRWCVHPMEGWDGTADGQPSANTLRRWEHFGQSGAKLIWGGEAFAIQGEARANPFQIGVVGDSPADLERAGRGAGQLLNRLLGAHQEKFGRTDDLLVGLQLTHSGRFCRPRDKKKLEPKIAYHHPVLDRKFGIEAGDGSVLLSDDEIERIIDNYIRAAGIAHRAGFGFVDIKHCHGYLAHELLSARTREGKFGGSLENRTRFARTIIKGIQAKYPGLAIGVRLSAFDHPPFKPDPSGGGGGKLGPGIPEEVPIPYLYGFGCNPNQPMEMDLSEPISFIKELNGLGVRLINVTGGSPYYNPHMQRPAMFPPSDGYQPPEDPLVGVARHIEVARQIKLACPEVVLVGTGFTYLQDFLPHVGQAVLSNGWVDFVGIGRLVLSYWDLPADTLAGAALQAKRICRTFSDCTTAPRNGLISGCYPLDAHYKESTEHVQLKAAKAGLRQSLTIRP